ncbi:17489_t:CDS:2, partial [Cetraspora pellucida]
LNSILCQDVYKTEAKISKGHEQHNNTLEIHSTKHQCQQTSENEKSILKPILDHNDFSEDEAFNILLQLIDHSEERWTLQCIHRYWSNNQYKKNTKLVVLNKINNDT